MPSGTEIPRWEVNGKERFEILEMKLFDGILKFGFTRIDDDAFLFPTPHTPPSPVTVLSRTDVLLIPNSIPRSPFPIPYSLKIPIKKPPLHTAELRGESLACLFLVFESFCAIGQRKCKEMDELR